MDVVLTCDTGWTTGDTVGAALCGLIVVWMLGWMTYLIVHPDKF